MTDAELAVLVDAFLDDTDCRLDEVETPLSLVLKRAYAQGLAAGLRKAAKLCQEKSERPSKIAGKVGKLALVTVAFELYALALESDHEHAWLLDQKTPESEVDEALREIGVDPDALATRGLEFVEKCKREYATREPGV